MIESSFVESGEGRLFHTLASEGLPVMLVHGGLLSHHMFDAQVKDLTPLCTLIRMDLRGYGQSSHPVGSYRHCDDVAAVLDHLGVGRAVIGGESFGGTVALDFAFAYPDLLAGLIFDAAGPILGWRWESFPLEAMFQVAKSEGVAGARREMLGSPRRCSPPPASAQLSLLP